jgi:3-polyprenyl-4-hydroxybenzoate decarboxylase
MAKNIIVAATGASGLPLLVECLKIIKENELTYNYKEYYFFRTSLVSFISYLADLDKINYKLEDSDLLYYTKIK